MGLFKKNILKETIIAVLCGFFFLGSSMFSASFAETVVYGGADENGAYDKGPADKNFILIDPLAEYKITLRLENGKAYGYAGVNRYSASYKVKEDYIEFGHIASTRMAGPENNMKAERQYLRLLEGKHVFSSNDGILKIGKLTFKAADPMAKSVR